MSDLYNRIYKLCTQKGISIAKMCSELSISRGNLTELKMERIKTLRTENLTKIADYFSVSIDYLLTGNNNEKTPAVHGERLISDDDLMFALWGDTDEVSKDDLEDVKNYAAFVRERKKRK